MINDFGRNSFVTHTTGLKERIQNAEKENDMRNYRGLTKEGKWVYGNYIYLRHDDNSESYFIQEIDAKYYSKPEYNRGWSHDKFEVIPETVGQSIIVEGKEFYEGDVTKDDSGNIGVVRFGKLPLDKSGDCVCVYPAFYIKCFGQLGQAPTYECQEIGEWMEIIGTIHTTHPELLEQDNG